MIRRPPRSTPLSLHDALPILKLVEIHREDISTLPRLMALLQGAPARVILFCDDLSFDSDDTSYKSLKAALEGDRKSTRLNSSHANISYAVFCLKKKTITIITQ